MHLPQKAKLTFCLLLASVLAGCTLPEKGRLPMAELQHADLAPELEPSLSVDITFFPPIAKAEQESVEQKLRDELADELNKAGFFRSITWSPDSTDLRISIVLTQAIATTSSQFKLYLATGGLSPVRAPCLYDLKAEVDVGKEKKMTYEIHDEASKLVFAPGWPPFSWDIDATSSAIRRNLYRTLLLRMYKDGVIRRCN